MYAHMWATFQWLTKSNVLLMLLWRLSVRLLESFPNGEVQLAVVSLETLHYCFVDLRQLFRNGLS
jgi:hypothetical protein